MYYQYLFTAQGLPAAVLAGDNLFDLEGRWLGIQDEDGNIWDPEGYFLGAVTDDDRLVRPKKPEGPPYFRSPRPHPSPPADISIPSPKESIELPPNILDALEGIV